MGLNKQSGNMYPFVTHTWNPIRGRCPHQCCYCYMKRFKVGNLRLEEKELQTNLGNSNFVFVGSSTDMWAADVPSEWIQKVLEHISKYNNTYLFQTKNPIRFLKFLSYFKENYILGTTLETNRDYNITKAPEPIERWMAFMQLNKYSIRRMISIEPIMDFNLRDFLCMLRDIRPEFVSVGADSKRNNLIEPPPEKIKQLIEHLKSYTNVIIKDNLKRLLD